MSNRSEMLKLLRAAQKQGCTVERTSGGHWRIITPDNQVTIAGFSPGTSNGVLITRRRLRKMGVNV